MIKATTIPPGRIGFYYLCSGNVVATLSQSPLDGQNTSTLIVPRFNPYEEISHSTEAQEGLFEIYIRPSHT
jgi:hypothetical protein